MNRWFSKNPSSHDLKSYNRSIFTRTFVTTIRMKKLNDSYTISLSLSNRIKNQCNDRSSSDAYTWIKWHASFFFFSFFFFILYIHSLFFFFSFFSPTISWSTRCCTVVRTQHTDTRTHATYAHVYTLENARYAEYAFGLST